MRRSYLLAAGATIVLLVLLAIMFFGRPKVDVEKRIQSRDTHPDWPASPTSNSRIVSKQEIPEPYFAHAIDFYGTVVDETGAPVSGAEVSYLVLSQLADIEKRYVTGPVSDADGGFSITGKRGASISVSVAHPDYHETDQSFREFLYFSDKSNLPTQAAPAKFVLRKKDVVMPLTKLTQDLVVPKDGKEVQIGIVQMGASDLTLQVWTSAPREDASGNAPFPWKLRLTVPGGGLVPYDGKVSLEAPENGYESSFEFDMPIGGRGGKWRDNYDQTFYVRLKGGHYARIRFRMFAGGGHFAAIESYYNPSGSRKLNVN